MNGSYHNSTCSYELCCWRIVGVPSGSDTTRGPDQRQEIAHPAEGGLRRSVTLPQAVALYAGAVVGAGVLILPGVGAGSAGPASLLAWGFDGLLGVPIALTFAALVARFPDAGGVASFVARA